MDTVWSRIIRILAILIGLGFLIWLAISAGPLIESLVIAGLLAYFLDVPVRFFMRLTKLSRTWASSIVYGLFLIFLGSIPAILGTVAFTQFNSWKAEMQNAFGEVQQLFSQPFELLGFEFDSYSMTQNLQTTLNNAIANIPGGSLNLLSAVTTNILWALVIFFSTFYLLRDGPKLKPWFISLWPEKFQYEIDHLLHDINRAWSIFMRVQLLMSFIILTLFSLGAGLVLWLFRSKLLPWSPLGLVVLLILVYTLVQQIDNLWLRPQLMGMEFKLHPGLVFVGLTGALALSGILGAFIIVPCMATVKIILSYLHRKITNQEPFPQDIEENTLSTNSPEANETTQT